MVYISYQGLWDERTVAAEIALQNGFFVTGLVCSQARSLPVLDDREEESKSSSSRAAVLLSRRRACRESV